VQEATCQSLTDRFTKLHPPVTFSELFSSIEKKEKKYDRVKLFPISILIP